MGRVRKIKNYLKQSGYEHLFKTMEDKNGIIRECEWNVKHIKKDKIIYRAIVTGKEFDLLKIDLPRRK